MPVTALPTSALNSVVPFARPVVPPMNPLLERAVTGGTLATGIISGALLINDIVGKAGGYQWRDDLLAQIGGRNVSTSSVPANFQGGQMTGVAYKGILEIKVSTGTRPLYYSWNNGGTGAFIGADTIPNESLWGNFSINGAIQGVTVQESATSYTFLVNNIPVAIRAKGGASGTLTSYRIASLKRVDGQPDTGGNREEKSPPVPSGYVPTNSPFKSDEDRKAATPKPLQASRANGLLGALGLASPIPTQSLSPSPVAPVNPNPVTTPKPSPPFAPTPTKPPLPNPPPEKEPKKPTPPINPTENKPPDLGTRLRDLGAIIALIASNTSPDSLRNAAKTGSCETLKSPSCTKDMEDRIKNPINDNIDASKAALAANQVAQNGVLASIVSKLDSAKTFSEKVARAARLDKVYNFLTFITVIHNAQMLSASLSTTLMDALSLGLATFNIKDENESPIDIQSIINKSVEDTVKGIIGASNYTELTERWKKAMTVYRAGTNMLYQVRSLWDSAKSLNEMTGANVGQLMNALRKDGVVSENAYPAKSESPMMVNSFMTRLENLDNAASALQGITSETSSMVETVAQLRKDREDFDKLVKESPKKSGVENDAAKLASQQEKTASASPVINPTDLAKPES